MLDGLNRYGLPVKYGVLGFVGCLIGVFLYNMSGLGNGSINYIMAAIAGGVGGAVGGWIRRRKGRKS